MIFEVSFNQMKTLIATGILVFCHMYGSGQQMTLDEWNKRMEIL
jgi:hypothetical protein